jgi:hypothetical protein
MNETPQWKICIVTTASTASERSSIKNSLLYADHTDWVSLEISFGLWRELAGVLCEAVQAIEAKQKDFRKSLDFKEDESHLAFCEEIRAGGAAPVLKQHFARGEAYSHLTRMLLHFKTPRKLEIENSLRRELDPIIGNAGVVVCRTSLLERQSKYWNARSAAHELMMGLSRVLLPDVSSLPIDAIMDVRTCLRDSLDPMRAEMLRLTEDLRQLVGGSTDSAVIAAEADNLIATRVEPVVREANRRTNELVNAKWRKLFVGAAKAFGFAGAGFVDPKLIGKAVQQTLETGALAFSDPEEALPTVGSTAQFVLRARGLAAQHDQD